MLSKDAASYANGLRLSELGANYKPELYSSESHDDIPTDPRGCAVDHAWQEVAVQLIKVAKVKKDWTPVINIPGATSSAIMNAVQYSLLDIDPVTHGLSLSEKALIAIAEHQGIEEIINPNKVD